MGERGGGGGGRKKELGLNKGFIIIHESRRR